MLAILRGVIKLPSGLAWMRERTFGFVSLIIAKFSEPLEWSAGRFVCQFETNGAPRRFPQLTFLLDYELEMQRIKGLAKAKADDFE